MLKTLSLILFLYLSLSAFSQITGLYNANITGNNFVELTPAPAKSPRFNNALVYGCGPNRDFLYRIPQGERPLTFNAKGLAPDQKTKIIKGTSPEKGTYNVIITAKKQCWRGCQVI